jgi:hypothetical protein
VIIEPPSFALAVPRSSLLILFWPLAKPLDDLVCATLAVAEPLGQLSDIGRAGLSKESGISIDELS